MTRTELDDRRYSLFMELRARKDRAYDAALAALDDPNVSEEFRRERIREFVEAGDDIIGLGTGEIH